MGLISRVSSRTYRNMRALRFAIRRAGGGHHGPPKNTMSHRSVLRPNFLTLEEMANNSFLPIGMKSSGGKWSNNPWAKFAIITTWCTLGSSMVPFVHYFNQKKKFGGGWI